MRTRPQITRKLRNLLRRPRSPAREPSPRCHLRRTLIRRRPCRVDKKTHGETLGPESGQCLREYPRGAQHEVKAPSNNCCTQEVLDEMEIVATHPVRPFQHDDSMDVQLASPAERHPTYISIHGEGGRSRLLPRPSGNALAFPPRSRRAGFHQRLSEGCKVVPHGFTG